MGRSVAYPSNSEFTVFMAGPEVEDGVDDYTEEWDWYESNLAERLVETFPSLSGCDTWDGRECHGFLENNFGKFYLAEYCGLVSLSFKLDDLSDNVYYGGSDTTGLGENWASGVYNTIVKKFESELYSHIGTMSNGESVYERM